jgi:hypothetical protein
MGLIPLGSPILGYTPLGLPMLYLEPCSRSYFDPKFLPMMGLILTLELPILGLELYSCDSSQAILAERVGRS